MTAAFLDSLHADPWAEHFLDLPSLNSSASGAIEASISRMREVARSEPQALRSKSLVVLGPPGAGKTHLFARLRRRLGPKAVFVHVRPLVHMEVTPRFVLGEVVKQLGYATHGVSGLPQAHAMVGSLLAHLSGEDVFFPSAFLAECEGLSDSDREARLDAALEQVLAIWQEADESYLRRLLQVPFAKTPTMQRSLLAWLSGRDCDETQLKRIGATASLGEEVALSALRTLSAVASLGAPIVIVFDQLENLVDAEGPGSRLLAYANLTAELVDSMRGLVLVHMALDTEWSRGIEPALNLSQRSRLLMARETLTLPTPSQREELLRLWIEQLPERPSLFPWPFSEAQAKRLCERPGVTPRMLLVECRRAFNGEASDLEAEQEPAQRSEAEPLGDEERHGLDGEWEERLTVARAAASEASEQRASLDPSRLADGLLACGRFLEGAKFEPIKSADGVQLRLTNDARNTRIALLNQPHHKSLGGAIAKLTVFAEREPVIVLRERAHELPPTWRDTLAKRSALLATGRARWLWLESEDAAKLLALDSLLQAARSGDLTDERGGPISAAAVAEWVSSKLEVPTWTIIREILGSDHDGDEPESKPERAAPLPPPGSGTALALLRRLRIASLDRVVREATRMDPLATRASVLAELERSSGEVRWFGRTIVGVRVP
ncbi:MAG TPA: hypothetical protein VNW92_13990 [Polyangiaceae bacterium]|jgi:hypothetical protein|nr:hypothetical protein [Polyangiaceae bacterium]